MLEKPMLVKQAIFMVAIFILTLLFVLLPSKIIPRRHDDHLSAKSQRIISFCNCFAGGVFLATCLLQLIPIIEMKFHEALVGSVVKMAPAFTQGSVIIGFFFILTVEHLVHLYQAKRLEKQDRPSQINMVNQAALLSSGSTGSDDSDVETLEERKKILKKKTSKKNPRSVYRKNGGLQSEETKCVAITLDKVEHVGSHHHSHHDHSQMASMFSKSLSLRCLLLLGALSTHSFFEGITLGLQTKDVKLVSLFIAVLIHECLCAFSLGCSLAKQAMRLSTLIQLSVVYSLMIPIGIGIGLALQTIETNPSGKITSAVIQGIAAGIFMYVIFMEILPAEIAKHNNSLWKILFLFLGVALVTCLKFSLPHPD